MLFGRAQGLTLSMLSLEGEQALNVDSVCPYGRYLWNLIDKLDVSFISAEKAQALGTEQSGLRHWTVVQLWASHVI